MKVFVRAQHETERFEVANQDLTHDMTRVMQVMSAMNPALTILINLGMVLVIWMGGLQTISGDLTVGQLVAFSNYLVTTMTPLLMMTNLANVWANGLASSRRIGEVLDTVSDVQPAQNPLHLPANVEARVEFRNVSFHYDGDEGGEVLKNISFTAQPGERVAILGATGAGKTTLINLIPRFYDVSAGQVFIDGMDVKDLDQDSLLSQIAIVPQETILFSGTIRENICYGRPDATEEETIAAAKSAQAYDFILNLPYGLDTHVEERGVNLSGGQKQRLAIARALIMQPKILILDDSTSSVDIETETRIQEALDVLMQGRTSFVVAQRISTVLKAEKILVLDHGQIAAQGNHNQLIRSSRVYQEIYESQLGNGLTDGAEVRSAA
ncbi:putative multidrug export ATP-binding/permease protein [bioreactor metagenome]|uniref:Putative multidrug export ATP-binding/permease protein n=1 Tax=bioreactor metagenome TaxID=1076179 RepID=A0A644Y5Y0_9ZZZZ